MRRALLFVIVGLAALAGAHAWQQCCSAGTSPGTSCAGGIGVCVTDYRSPATCGAYGQLLCDVGTGNACTDCSAYPGTTCGVDQNGAAQCQCPPGESWTGGGCAIAQPGCPAGWQYNATDGLCERWVAIPSAPNPFTDVGACANATPVASSTSFICLDDWAVYRRADEPYYFNSQTQFVNLTGSYTAEQNVALRDSITQVCKDGALVPGVKKYAPDAKTAGFCKQDECFYYDTTRSVGACVPPDSWFGDDLCVRSGTSATWSTRTQLLATTLYNRSSGKTFILHCDTNAQALNNYLPTDAYTQPSSVGIGSAAPAVNSFCVLTWQSSFLGFNKRYATEAIGTTLNGADGTQATEGATNPAGFSKALNGTEIEAYANSCDNTLANTDGAYYRCNANGESRGAIWYNSQSDTLIASPDNGFNPAATRLSTFFGFLQSLWTTAAPQPLISFSGTELYVAVSGSKTVQAKTEPTNAGTQATIVYQGIDPSGLCQQYGVTDCTQQGGLWIVHIPDPTRNVWNAFTLGVRPQ